MHIFFLSPLSYLFSLFRDDKKLGARKKCKKSGEDARSGEKTPTGANFMCEASSRYEGGKRSMERGNERKEAEKWRRSYKGNLRCTGKRGQRDHEKKEERKRAGEKGTKREEEERVI